MKQEDMKKFEYKLELYQFKANNDLASNIEKAFRQYGRKGQERPKDRHQHLRHGHIGRG